MLLNRKEIIGTNRVNSCPQEDSCPISISSSGGNNGLLGIVNRGYSPATLEDILYGRILALRNPSPSNWWISSLSTSSGYGSDSEGRIKLFPDTFKVLAQNVQQLSSGENSLNINQKDFDSLPGTLISRENFRRYQAEGFSQSDIIGNSLWTGLLGNNNSLLEEYADLAFHKNGFMNKYVTCNINDEGGDEGLIRELLHRFDLTREGIETSLKLEFCHRYERNIMGIEIPDLQVPEQGASLAYISVGELSAHGDSKITRRELFPWIVFK